MGHVYKARHVQLGKAFALKLISPAFAADHAARTRFNQEAKLASEIAHPNIVSIVDYGEDEQFGAFMVMELVEGEALSDAALPMAVPRALNLLGQVADALDHIHKRGIVHGDVKADNIMVTLEQVGARRRQVARLLDFGLARRPDTTIEHRVDGSPHYLAPERAAGAAASVATDVYALGVLGYLLLAGALPFSGTVTQILTQHVQAEPAAMTARRGQPIDGAVEALIARAMAKDPAKRHRSAAAFRNELDTVMDMLDITRRRARGSGGMPATSTRDALLVEAFERSQLPQAIVSADGVVAFANRAFSELLGAGDASVEGMPLAATALAACVPGLGRAVQACHEQRAVLERRANVLRGDGERPLALALWLTPLAVPGYDVQLVVRVEPA